MQWSKKRLAELLVGIETDVDASIGRVKLKELKSLTGEACITTRKGGKKFAVFDLTIALKWEGQWGLHGKTITGEANIAEFASTNDEDEIMYTVTANEDEDGKRELTQLMDSLKTPILQRLQTFSDEIAKL